MESKHIIAFVVGLVIIVGGIAFAASRNEEKGPDLTGFAQCLKDEGAVFYGAFWCPHCQATKALFGKAKAALPYVECSTPDAQGQTQICKDKDIQNYPTWIFADGTREVGELTLERLSQKTGCPLPGSEGVPASDQQTTTPPTATSSSSAR